MTIRFAAAWGGATPVVLRPLCLSAPLDAVNDNQLTAVLPASAPHPVQPDVGAAIGGVSLIDDPYNDALYHDALHHFAVHGLSAAEVARGHAQTADAMGDRKSCNRWIAICRQFDRRMANRFLRTLSREHP